MRWKNEYCMRRNRALKGDECGREYGIGWMARWVVHDETASWLVVG